jgi:hypothetical protein
VNDLFPISFFMDIIERREGGRESPLPKFSAVGMRPGSA